MPAHNYLLISSNPTNLRKTLQASLPGEAELAVAATPQEGLRLIHTGHYDAVFYEADPEDEEGIVLCRRLRRQSSAPLVLVAPRASGEQVLRGYNLGADLHIDPLADSREIKARLSALLRRMDPSA